MGGNGNSGKNGGCHIARAETNRHAGRPAGQRCRRSRQEAYIHTYIHTYAQHVHTHTATDNKRQGMQGGDAW